MSRAGPEYGRKALARRDGTATPVLVVCSSHPFWWPVKPSLAKYGARLLTGAYKDSQYRTFYFHNAGPEVDAALRRYITGIGNAVEPFASGMASSRFWWPWSDSTEACLTVAKQLGGVPVFTSDRYDMYELVSVLRRAR